MPTDVDVEAEARRAFEAGDLRRAATVAVSGYGPELYGFLVVAANDPDLAADAFGDLCHHLWRDLPKFRWECSLRTWAYTLARRRLYAAREARRAAAYVPLSRIPEVEALVRTATASYLRTAVRAEVARIREQLADEDRMLLVLRVDRDLSWREIAEIVEDNEPALRKRFERIKERLRTLAKQAKLI